MVWAMAELIRRPAMLRKVQEEVRSIVDGGGRERVHPDDVAKLRYLKAVVKETLRLHPAVPLLLPRETLRHVSICGHDVPAKTRVLVNAWAIGRDPRSWGDRPEEFDPDRFDGDDGVVDFNGTHFELVPFGAGRRMCPGMGMGVATMEFALANLLYCFDWELPEGVQVSMEEAGGLTVHKKTPLLLVPTRYKCASHTVCSRQCLATAS
jgi:4-hydroxyphenylacetaldehyde oxime monooxygenase